MMPCEPAPPPAAIGSASATTGRTASTSAQVMPLSPASDSAPSGLRSKAAFSASSPIRPRMKFSRVVVSIRCS